MMRRLICVLTMAIFTFRSITAMAQDSTQERLNVHFQATYVYQYKPAFHSPYEGINSLTGEKEKQNSITATLFLGARLWKGAAVYINPEVAGGSGLSGALGMAGSSNGETFRVGSPAPTLYWGRYYLQQAFSLGKQKDWQDDDANQLRGYIPHNYIKVLLGKYSLGDMIDHNEYSNTPRSQFMNWALMNNGAWDYAANVRGYTYSLSSEMKLNDLTYKLSFATLPKEANGEKLNTNFKDSFSLAINAEIGKSYVWHNRPGNIRMLAFHNTAAMGNYAQANNDHGKPDVVSTREMGRTKWGLGLSFDQELNDLLGIFARAGWNDGKNETWAFTEIDRTASVGLSLSGRGWKRMDDNAGVAVVVNGISADHQHYLAEGGAGFILGDGALNYGLEAVTELYYSLKPSATLPLWITGDYQFAINPGYNKDRGPVNICSVRVHTEF